MKKTGLWFVTMLLILFTACDRTVPPPQGNAFYFWRTTLAFTPYEKASLDSLHISRLYLHLFDVVRDTRKGMHPDATLTFRDTIPRHITIIPTIFIDSKALRAGDTDTDSLADLIVRRADKMMTSNGYPIPTEIQLDFDWTPTNREVYFDILRRAGELMHARGGMISTTVRLHQLRDKIPPADYGTLMVYNIGDFADPQETNSILNLKNLTPWLTHLKHYTLPLTMALPIYSWDLVFSGAKFRFIARGENVADTSRYEAIDSIHFRNKAYRSVTSSHSHADKIYPGHVLRHEHVDIATLRSAAQAVRHAAGSDLPLTLYHLDENSLNTYNINEVKTLFPDAADDDRRDSGSQGLH